MFGRYTTGPGSEGRGYQHRWVQPTSAPILGPPMTASTDHVIDLRSDTVTHPTPEMRLAMAEAELGDDVFGDDPTVIRLEERAAELLGKEAALFVSSGTQGNLVSQMAHLGKGMELIAEAESHTVQWEAGA